MEHYLVIYPVLRAFARQIHFLHYHLMRVDGTGACNSSLGMVTNLTGAFLAFPMTNEQWIKPAKSSTLRYADAP